MEKTIKRQHITIGSIVEIDIEGQYYVYAQIARNKQCVFWDFRTKSRLNDLSQLNGKPVLFIVDVYNYVISRGFWQIIGKMPLEERLSILPNQFIYHRNENPEFELYNPNDGTISPSSMDECRYLERAAVWDKNHIEDRIRDHYNGKPCMWLDGDYKLFPDRKPSLD